MSATSENDKPTLKSACGESIISPSSKGSDSVPESDKPDTVELEGRDEEVAGELRDVSE